MARKLSMDAYIWRTLLSKTQTPDTKPGNYYASVRRDDGEARCLAGPFRDDHQGALDIVARAREIAQELNPRAAWYSYGTLRTAYSYDKPGILNTRLGLTEGTTP